MSVQRELLRERLTARVTGRLEKLILSIRALQLRKF
jgi:hypothetical protein